MQCLYCGKPLGLLRELADGEFCSGDHRQRYRSLTKRAFGRLMQSRPEPASFTSARHLAPELPQRPVAAPPLAGLLPPQGFQPSSKTMPIRRESSPAGPFFQFYTALMAPAMPALGWEGTLAHASARPLPVPATACSKGSVLVPADPMVFSPPLVTSPLADFELSPIDLPMEALGTALSYKPSGEPLLLPPRLQETAAARIPTNGAAYCSPTLMPSLPAAPPAPDLCASLPWARHTAPAAALASLPTVKLAGGQEPLPWPAAPVTLRLRLELPVPFETAHPAPVAVPPQPLGCASKAAPCAGALAFVAPDLRRLGLSMASDRLALRAGEKVREEVLGAEMSSDPASGAVKPSLGAGSVLPALASLFRYGRGSRSVPALPHVTEGLNPHNRLAFPVAYRELPMPVQTPRVPRSSDLRIVETFEYLKPLEDASVNLLQNLMRLWSAVPVYLRFATVATCVILLVWAVVPGREVAGLVASRWGRMQQQIEQRAAVELTEDFHDDMSQWGGSGEWARSWRVSQAGYVRPGRLALYEPSMKMRDYHVEFLAQIERQAVSFAYRATDTENFYAAKISVAKAGPLPVLSLVRYPVIGGHQGPKVEIPIRLLLHNNTPYRVQLTVRGNGFSTSIEGQLVDFWTDDRLQTGGFGFFSDTGESARVYWMRLSHQDDFVGRVCAYIRQPAILRRRTEVLQ